MIYLKIRGRAGNQLFQFATVKNFQTKYYKDEEIAIDFSDLKKLGTEEDGFTDSLKDFKVGEYKKVNKIEANIWQKILIFIMKIPNPFFRLIGLKDKADISQIYVQVKLSVIKDIEQYANIVSRISQYANTQNKVNDADFTANNPALIEIEKLSRYILSPVTLEKNAVSGDYTTKVLTNITGDKFMLQNGNGNIIVVTNKKYTVGVDTYGYKLDEVTPRELALTLNGDNDDVTYACWFS